jgi:Tfp pilus assembly protein PilF
LNSQSPGQSSPAQSPLSPTAQAQRHAFIAQQHFLKQQWPAARDHFLQAIRLDPENPGYHFNAAICLWSNGQVDEAGPCLQTAVRLKPNLAQAQAWLGEWSLAQGQIAAALQATAKAIDLEPNNPQVIFSRAWVLASGNPDAAWPLVQQLLASTPMTPTLARLYGMLAHRFGQQSQALSLIEQILSTPGASADPALQFVAADLLDRAGRYDDAFSLATKANASFQLEPYDALMHERLTQRLIDYFTPDRIRSPPKSSHLSSKPIFIVGMPRSGTSLVEQILASHPEVHGGGELKFMHQLWTRLLVTLNSPFDEYPACLDRLTSTQATDLSQTYLTPLTALNPAAARITDKMPLNFLHLGLISIFFPGSRIIHCTRNPLDTCLSCFFTHFTYPHPFKSNLTTLGHFYRHYAKLMAHWKSAIDLPILEVSYEQLVSDQEPQTRRLLDFLDLPWNDRCLSFHQSTRPCSTASVMQVRQPLYKTSLSRWRNYEKHLGPLQAALNG